MKNKILGRRFSENYCRAILWRGFVRVFFEANIRKFISLRYISNSMEFLEVQTWEDHRIS